MLIIIKGCWEQADITAHYYSEVSGATWHRESQSGRYFGSKHYHDQDEEAN